MPLNLDDYCCVAIALILILLSIVATYSASALSSEISQREDAHNE